jgi:hypothetical protein
VRRDHGAQWKLLPLHELRINERMQLGTFVRFDWSRVLSAPVFLFCEEIVPVLRMRDHSVNGTMSGL